MVQAAHRPTVEALLRALLEADLRPSLGLVRVPALVVGGTWDHLVPPPHLRILARGLPKAELRVLKRGTHVLCLSRAQEFSAILTETLRRWTPRGPARHNLEGG